MTDPYHSRLWSSLKSYQFLVDSAIKIGLLVGVTVLSVCVFGAITYAVASRKTKDKDSKYGHLYPVSSHGFSPGIYT